MVGRVIVCTHHKAGTVWMGSTFKSLAHKLGVPLVNLRTAAVEQSGTPMIIIDPGSRWYTLGLEHPSDRVFHLIRDPRDMVISGMHYHRTANEPSLHKPRQVLGGKTYHEALNALPDDRARLLFEMDRARGSSLRAMMHWNYARPESFECRYEELIEDSDATLFASACSHLGIKKLKKAKRCFLKHSLFSRSKKRPEHARNGAPRQWQSVFDRALAQEFDSRCGDILIALGYETDHSWVDACEANAFGAAAGGGEPVPAL